MIRRLLLSVVLGLVPVGLFAQEERQEIAEARMVEGRLTLRSQTGREAALKDGVYVNDAGIKILVQDGTIAELAGPAGSLGLREHLTDKALDNKHKSESGARRGKVESAGGRRDEVETLGAKVEVDGAGPVDLFKVETTTVDASGVVSLRGSDGTRLLLPAGRFSGPDGATIVIVDGRPTMTERF